jgi:predicted dehydrogenase
MISVLMTNFTDGLYKGLPWNQLFSNNPQLQKALTPVIAPGQNSYSDPKVSGGGQIYCQVSHVAAYMGFLTGREPLEVFADFDNAGTAVDVYDTLNLRLDRGTLVSIASTGATMLSERNFEVRVYGTTGMMFLELWKGTMEVHDQQCNVATYQNLPAEGVYPMGAPANNLVECVLGRAANGSPATLGLYAMKIIDAACRAASSHRNISVGASLAAAQE